MAWQLKPKTVWPTAASKSKCAAPGATPSQRSAKRPGNQAKQQPCFWGPRPRVWCPCSGVRRSRRHAFRKVRQWGRLHGFGCARQRRRGRGIWSGAADAAPPFGRRFKWLSLPRATPRPAFETRTRTQEVKRVTRMEAQSSLTNHHFLVPKIWVFRGSKTRPDVLTADMKKVGQKTSQKTKVEAYVLLACLAAAQTCNSLHEACCNMALQQNLPSKQDCILLTFEARSRAFFGTKIVFSKPPCWRTHIWTTMLKGRKMVKTQTGCKAHVKKSYDPPSPTKPHAEELGLTGSISPI